MLQNEIHKQFVNKLKALKQGIQQGAMCCYCSDFKLKENILAKIQFSIFNLNLQQIFKLFLGETLVSCASVR